MQTSRPHKMLISMNATRCLLLLLVVVTWHDSRAAEGGSSCTPDAQAADVDALPCNIDRWQACTGRKKKKKKKNCLTAEAFSNTYLHRRPVIVSGLAKDWPAMEHWTSPQAFLKRHGDVFVGVKDAGDLVLGGPGVVSATIPTRAATSLLDEDPDLFVFDRMDGRSSRALLPDFTTRG